MERKPKPGQSRHARIVDLPKPAHPHRLCLMEGGNLLEVEVDPQMLGDGLQTGNLPTGGDLTDTVLNGGVLNGCALGDLVTFRLDGQGRLTELTRQGGPLAGRWQEGGDALRWRKPGEQPTRMAYLRLRGRILQEIRGYFAEEGFLEVETPALVPAPTPEPQFAPIPAGGGYLITSPEFQLKRMLVGGFDKIYRLGPVFRGGEAGGQHNPEFTMLEWYRAQTDLEAMAADLENLLGRLAPLARMPEWRDGADGEAAEAVPGDLSHATTLEEMLGNRPFARATVGEMFARHLGMDISGITTMAALRESALAANHPGAHALPDDFERAFFALWDSIEANFGPAPLLVSDWPAPLASLARLKAEDPTVAERMELYAGGYELANGFAELTDAAEQRRRFEADLAARKAQGLPALPMDERFLAALEQGMPPASGMALGVERLVMLISGAEHIRQVLPFTADEL